MDKEDFKTECIKIKSLPKDEQEQAKDRLMEKISDDIFNSNSDETKEQLKEFGEILHNFFKFLNEEPKEFSQEFTKVWERVEELEESSKELEDNLRDLRRQLKSLEDDGVKLKVNREYWVAQQRIFHEVKEILEA